MTTSVFPFVLSFALVGQCLGQNLWTNESQGQFHHENICGKGFYLDPKTDECLGVPGGGDAISVFEQQTHCHPLGFTAHPNNTNYYEVCLRRLKILAKCPINRHFNETSRVCEMNESVELDESISSPCHECHQNSNNNDACTKIIIICPMDFKFCPLMNSCIPQEVLKMLQHGSFNNSDNSEKLNQLCLKCLKPLDKIISELKNICFSENNKQMCKFQWIVCNECENDDKINRSKEIEFETTLSDYPFQFENITITTPYILEREITNDASTRTYKLRTTNFEDVHDNTQLSTETTTNYDFIKSLSTEPNQEELFENRGKILSFTEEPFSKSSDEINRGYDEESSPDYNLLFEENETINSESDFSTTTLSQENDIKTPTSDFTIETWASVTDNIEIVTFTSKHDSEQTNLTTREAIMTDSTSDVEGQTETTSEEPDEKLEERFDFENSFSTTNEFLTSTISDNFLKIESTIDITYEIYSKSWDYESELSTSEKSFQNYDSSKLLSSQIDSILNNNNPKSKIIDTISELLNEQTTTEKEILSTLDDVNKMFLPSTTIGVTFEDFELNRIINTELYSTDNSNNPTPEIINTSDLLNAQDTTDYSKVNEFSTLDYVDSTEYLNSTTSESYEKENRKSNTEFIDKMFPFTTEIVLDILETTTEFYLENNEEENNSKDYFEEKKNSTTIEYMTEGEVYTTNSENIKITIISDYPEETTQELATKWIAKVETESTTNIDRLIEEQSTTESSHLDEEESTMNLETTDITPTIPETSTCICHNTTENPTVHGYKITLYSDIHISKIPNCTSLGFFRMESTCHIFYECQLDENKQFKDAVFFKCPVPLPFNIALGICDHPKNVPECASFNGNFHSNCTTGGLYPIPDDPNRYYNCSEVSPGMFLRKIMSCPKGCSFNPAGQHCLPLNSYYPEFSNNISIINLDSQVQL